MADSQISIWAEKSLNESTGWTKVSSSFISPSITIYDSSGDIISNQPVNYYFTNSYSSSDTFYILYNTSSIPYNGTYDSMTWNINPKIEEAIYPSYYYRLSMLSSNSTPIVFNPTSKYVTNHTTWNLDIKNEIETEVSITPSESGTNIGKFWSTYVSGSISYYNKIVLESEGGNLNYAKGFYQTQIPYVPSTNPRFKKNIEPVDTQFPNVNDPWELKIGDQIRFENDESKTFDVIDISHVNEFTPPKLLLTLDRGVPVKVNLNFFLIRRWKSNRNNIVLNKTFPYTNDLISASLAPTTTGFIFPKYPVDEIAKNPDKIIRDLIDKKIIE